MAHTTLMLSVLYVSRKSPKVFVMALASASDHFHNCRERKWSPQSEAIAQSPQRGCDGFDEKHWGFPSYGYRAIDLQIVFTLCSVYRPPKNRSRQAMVEGFQQVAFLKHKMVISSLFVGSLDFLKRGTSNEKIICRSTYPLQNTGFKPSNGLYPTYLLDPRTGSTK